MNNIATKDSDAEEYGEEDKGYAYRIQSQELRTSKSYLLPGHVDIN